MISVFQGTEGLGNRFKNHSSKVKPVEVEPRLAQKNLGVCLSISDALLLLGGQLLSSALPGPCSNLHPHSTLTPSGLPKAHLQPEIFFEIFAPPPWCFLIPVNIDDVDTGHFATEALFFFRILITVFKGPLP